MQASIRAYTADKVNVPERAYRRAYYQRNVLCERKCWQVQVLVSSEVLCFHHSHCP